MSHMCCKACTHSSKGDLTKACLMGTLACLMASLSVDWPKKVEASFSPLNATPKTEVRCLPALKGAGIQCTHKKLSKIIFHMAVVVTRRGKSRDRPPTWNTQLACSSACQYLAQWTSLCLLRKNGPMTLQLQDKLRWDKESN